MTKAEANITQEEKAVLVKLAGDYQARIRLFNRVTPGLPPVEELQHALKCLKFTLETGEWIAPYEKETVANGK